MLYPRVHKFIIQLPNVLIVQSVEMMNLLFFAAGTRLMSLLHYFQSYPVDIVQLFGRVQPPDLNVMFDVKRPRFDKRTSSANWESTPGIGLLYVVEV